MPMPAVLRTHLEAQYARTGTCMRVFADGRKPFAAPAVVVRAKKAWTALKLEGIGLHECRHAYASFMIAAGANAKSLSSTSGTRTSRSRWTATNLMPGNEAEGAELLHAFLAAVG
jgi:hypothetical protein